MPHPFLQIGPRITALPIIHGSGDFALEVRRVMLADEFDCLAVPLPPSFQEHVEEAIQLLPTPTAVLQNAASTYRTEWSPDGQDDDDDERPDDRVLSYVPVDPCQGVIAALRIAIGEHLPRAFIDLETDQFESYSLPLPDPYALKKAPIERFAAALAPSIGRLPDGQPRSRVAHMARRLQELERRRSRILLVCSVLEWPWIREAYMNQQRVDLEDELVGETEIYEVDLNSLMFFLGELPFISGLFESARSELADDDNLSIDGVKELLLTARESYLADFKGRARRITPQLLSQCLQYIRNLSLIEHRLTPDLYTIVVAAKQVAGDQFALHVAVTAAVYPFATARDIAKVTMGVDQLRLPDGEIVDVVSRLPGPPVVWRNCELKRRPDRSEKRRWQTKWNPFTQCSYPPEDELIENFRSHVFDRAKTIMGADLARTEKFSTSIMDGIDIRETLRHWYDGELYVKVLPPSHGTLDCTVMLFDSPADPRRYSWRTTWFAEHDKESTLAFFATNFMEELVGPGIGLATYGGAMFLYPPIPILDVWRDPRLDFTETMEERLLAAACLHSSCPQIALLSHLPPGAGWRRLARCFGKRWIHVPLAHFSDATVQQLRMVHVLNGGQVRSYAADFIRRA